ncbi:MAG: RsmE family RNA methyltransferase [Kiritimatiellia bacterium]|nr:RsmE family RNA methyltransferase [Kiritimatiellia bacterium]
MGLLLAEAGKINYTATMHRHYCTRDQLVATKLILSGDESKHLATVLRAQPGEAVECFDGQGCWRRYFIESVAKRAVTLVADGNLAEAPRPTCPIHLYACICKGERWDWLLEKAVELGANRIVPVLSKRCVIRLERGERAAKHTKWARRLIEAAKQCGAHRIPELSDAMPLESLNLPPLTYVAALSEDARPLMPSLPAEPPNAVGWFSGPEGDFSPDELAWLRRQGCRLVTLGPLVLRAETAALYGLSVLNCWRNSQGA